MRPGKLLQVVEPLKIKHPEFGQRLRDAAKLAGVQIKDIKDGMGVTYEMARRYWKGIAKPTNEADRIKLAAIVRISPAELEYGEVKLQAEEAAAAYVTVTDEALDVAKAWSKLPAFKKDLYRDAIFRDAAIEHIFPWLRFGRPTQSSYDQLEKTIERSYQAHIKQLKLDI